MIQKDNQRTLADQLFHPEKQHTKTAAFLANAYRNRPLSSTQQKRNRNLGRIRAVVEDPFAWMKTPQIGHKHPSNGASKAHDEHDIEYDGRYVQKKSSKC